MKPMCQYVLIHGNYQRVIFVCGMSSQFTMALKHLVV